jgi:hypothetical protein
MFSKCQRCSIAGVGAGGALAVHMICMALVHRSYVNQLSGKGIVEVQSNMSDNSLCFHN